MAPRSKSPPPSSRVVDAALLSSWPLPESRGDKEARGSVLVVAGCREMPGAAVLAAEAAMRAGAGKLEVAVPVGGASLVAGLLLEAKVGAFDVNRGGGPLKAEIASLAKKVEGVDAVLLGPGMVDDASVAALARATLRTRTPALIDAAALSAFEDPRLRCRHPAIVTPHAGEMARLANVDKRVVEADPIGHAHRLAVRANVVVVMKGQSTHVVSPDERVWTYEDGHAGLGMSGSGDVLAGVIVGLLARGASAEQAAVWGVALHGRAAHAAAAHVGRLGYLARELSREVPRIMEALR